MTNTTNLLAVYDDRERSPHSEVPRSADAEDGTRTRLRRASRWAARAAVAVDRTARPRTEHALLGIFGSDGRSPPYGVRRGAYNHGERTMAVRRGVRRARGYLMFRSDRGIDPLFGGFLRCLVSPSCWLLVSVRLEVVSCSPRRG